ncbi:MAG: hypothetical protein QXL86_02215 [Candidatus Aenigmatarchaeota archaeon]
MKSRKGDLPIEAIIFGIITVIALVLIIFLFRDKLYKFFQAFAKSAIANIKSLFEK